MESKKLIRKLWKRFPLKIAKIYHDYVGVMVNCLHQETNKIVTCLDVTEKVIEIAKKEHADLIISHHPFLYGKKSYILKTDSLKKEMYDDLLNNNIPVYSFHTNFDECKDGMNDALATLLNLKNIRPIPYLGMGRMGELENEMDVNSFSKYALNCLNLKYGQLIDEGKKYIKTVGIIGGSGSRDYQKAMDAGCDIYLSGDTPYHIRLEIKNKHYNYLHVDHEVEKIFVQQMKKILLEIDSSLEIIEVNDVEQSKLIVL